MSSCIDCLTSSYPSPSSRMNGAMYVEGREGLGPRPLFCSVPRKLTIWPQADLKWRGRMEAMAPRRR